jgi:hypothetical protein
LAWLLLAYARMTNKPSLVLAAALLMGGGPILSNCGHEKTAGDPQEIGEARLAVVLSGGAILNSVTYNVSGPGGLSRMGTVDVSRSATISLLLPLPAGGPYTINLSGTTVDGGTTCTGTGTFSVVAKMTTPVAVGLMCREGSKSGSVLVTGALNICPVVDGIGASPSEVVVGSTIALSSAAHDSDTMPSPLTYAWSAPSGTFAPSATAQNPSFKCTQAGPVTISLTVSDGDAATGCTDTQTVTVTCSPITSSQSPYLVPVTTGAIAKAIITVGDSPNSKPDGTPYRAVGLIDGLGAFDNGDGTFTVLANHEAGSTAGIMRAHGSKGAFVSRWTVRKSDLAVLKGEDLGTQVLTWNTTTSSYNAPGTRAFARFCSADLPALSAFWDAATSTGFNGRLFMNGEESGNEGAAFAHGLDGTIWELPRLGKFSWENSMAAPGAGLKTVVAGTDDSTPGQVYVYVGTKTNAGSAVDKAGLTNGLLYGIKVTGFPNEDAATGIPTGAFTLEPLGNVENTTGAALESASNTAGVTRFNRPEDGAWDPASPNDFYFVTTASFTGNSRLWRARFTDITNPTAGGTIEMLLSGNEGQKMMDNIGMDAKGHIMIVEDVGNNAHNGKVLRYDIATDTLTTVFQHDPNRFITGAPGFLTQDEEASGIIDASAILGPGWWLVDDQAHYGIGDTELIEGGQLLAIYDPATL